VFYAGTGGEDITVPDVLPERSPPTNPAPPCRTLPRQD